MMHCPVCGKRTASNHRYCPHCGSIVGEVVALERKQITALVVDICGSTEIVAALDLENGRLYLDAALEIMSEPVEAFGGTVQGTQGDGLLAFFGAPTAQEDHAYHACLAALTIQQRSRTSRTAYPVRVRVGIHSGEVLAGISSGRLRYRVDGSPLSIATRLEKLAGPGEILLSGATQRLVDTRMITKPAGTRVLRGIAKPVELHVLDPKQSRSTAEPLARRREWAPLIGRDLAIDALRESTAVAVTGGLRMIGIRGEAGVGKSRLIVEWSRRPECRAFRCSFVVARAYMSRNPHSLVVALMRELIGVKNAPDFDAQNDYLRRQINAWPAAAETHRLAALQLLNLDVTGDEWGRLTPRQRRSRIGDALHWLLLRDSAAHPPLIIIEDIDLADSESHRILGSLLPRLQSERSLWLVSARHDFEQRWIDAPWFVEHWLQPLADVEARAQIASLIGTHVSLQRVTEVLIERGAGNPFFIEQLALSLINDGMIEGTPGAYRRVGAFEDVLIPPTITALVAARIDRLGAAAKASLEAAAILEDPFDAGCIAAMLDVDAADVERHLSAGVGCGLLSAPLAAGHQADFAYRHALVHDAVVATLTRDRKRVLHGRAYAALAKTDDLAATLTQHAYLGERWPEVCDWAVKAMERAVAQSANRDALRLFETGVSSAHRIDDERQHAKAEIALRLAAIGAFMPLGKMDEAIANLERAEALAREIGDERCQATVSLQLAVVLWMQGRFTQGLVHAQQAADAGLRSGRRNLQMTAAQVRVMMHHALGHYAKALDDALYVEREFHDELSRPQIVPGWATLPVINLLSFVASSRWRLGDADAGLETCERAYRILERFDHPYSRGLIDFVCGQILIEQERHGEAKNLLRKSVQSCELNDVPTLLPLVLSLLGGTMAVTGEAQAGLALLDEAIAERAYKAAGAYADVFVHRNRALALIGAGRMAEAVDAARLAVANAEATEQWGHRAEALIDLGRALMAAGEAELAGLRFGDAIAQARACAMPAIVTLAQRQIHEASRRSAPGLPSVSTMAARF